MPKFDILSPMSNLIMKDTNIVQFHEDMKKSYMEFPNAQHFATGIIMTNKLSVVEFSKQT